MRSQPIPVKIDTLPFDAIIIGAGVNGIGIARDAAMRGLKVLVLEKNDLGAETSSWNSRLIHGGLRYLEHGELGLVRESLRERERLLRLAPHLCKPLWFFFPSYNGNHRAPLTVRTGMFLYDILSFDKSLSRHRAYSLQEVRRELPSLTPEGLKGACGYYEVQMEAVERLCVENALSARQHGAVVLTHARVDRLILEQNAVRGVEFTDLLENRTYVARAPLTVNVSGPWVDEVLKGLGRPVKRQMGGTKGSHLIVDPFPGAPSSVVFYEAMSDGRPILVIPWNGRYLIGSTDLRYEDDLDQVVTDDSEIEYLIRETNRLIPGANLTADSVHWAYAGVRPLPYQDVKSEADITRKHIILDHGPEVEGLLSIIGGKLTTYRSLAEQTVDKMYQKLGKKVPGCSTHQVALPGGVTGDYAAFAQWFGENSELPEKTASRLLSIYGVRALEILEIAREHPDLKEPFCPDTGAIGAELLMAFQREMAETLADALLRRTMVGLGNSVGLEAAEPALQIARKYLGWSDQRASAEMAEFVAYVKRFRPRKLREQKNSAGGSR